MYFNKILFDRYKAGGSSCRGEHAFVERNQTVTIDGRIMPYQELRDFQFSMRSLSSKRQRIQATVETELQDARLARVMQHWNEVEQDFKAEQKKHPYNPLRAETEVGIHLYHAIAVLLRLEEIIISDESSVESKELAVLIALQFEDSLAILRNLMPLLKTK